MIDQMLTIWTSADLSQNFLHTYYGQAYRISIQWTIWRSLAHDLHHGDELVLMLGMQGIQIPDLGDLGGYLTVPTFA